MRSAGDSRQLTSDRMTAVPSGAVHDALDLIIHGHCDEDLHRWKDEPAQRLGRYHRILRHAHYNKFPAEWSLRDPFPPCIQWDTFKLAKEHGRDYEWAQMYQTHDYFDRLWDMMSRKRRLTFIKILIGVLHHPDILKSWAGVDVIEGTVQVTEYNGTVHWVSEPTLHRSWRQILAYVEARSPEDLL